MHDRPVSVIEFAGYRRRAGELLSAEQRDAVIDLVAYEPTCGDLIPGTGGFYNDAFPILLLALYAKNEKSDLTQTEKREFSKLVKEIVSQWKRREEK